MGLPVVTWDKATFDQVTGVLQSYLHIPKDWFYDLNTFDAAELLGSTVGVVAMALHWESRGHGGVRQAGGKHGACLPALAANPTLLVVTVVALARAFQQARQTGDYAALVDGQVKGRHRNGEHPGGRVAGGGCRRTGGRGAAGRAHRRHPCQQGHQEGERCTAQWSDRRQRTDGGATGEGGKSPDHGQGQDEAAVARLRKTAASGRPGPL